MLNNTKPATIFMSITIGIILLLNAGCIRIVEDPWADEFNGDDAPEFEYLVDIEGCVDDLEDWQYIMTGYLDPDFKDFKNVINDVLEQTDIMAEADETMIHARGEYQFDIDELIEIIEEETYEEIPVDLHEYSPLGVLVDAGPAEVKLPSRFPPDRWIGHLFVGNPDDLLLTIYEKTDSLMGEMRETVPYIDFMPLEIMLGMVGINNVPDAIEWMGDEFLLFGLTNPDFEPYGDISPDDVPYYYQPMDMIPYYLMDNPPIYLFIAFATDEPDGGLEMVQTIFRRVFMMAGGDIELVEKEINGYEALVLPIDDLIEEILYDEEEQEIYRSLFKNVIPSAIVAIPGYVLIGSRSGIDAALDMYSRGSLGTDREATFEIAWNLGAIKEILDDSIEGWLGDILRSPDLSEWNRDSAEQFLEFYDDISQFNDLGMNRSTFEVTSDSEFALDLFISRQLIELVDYFKEKIEEENMYAEPYPYDRPDPEYGYPGSQPDHAVTSVSGTVYLDGRPIAFGTVQAFDEMGELVDEERSNQFGHYTIRNLDPGTYTLVYVDARGRIMEGETVIEVRPGRSEVVDLKLSSNYDD